VTGTEIVFAQSTLAGFLLALGRTAGFVLVSPPFNTRTIPAQGRVAVAVSLALVLGPFAEGTAPSLTSTMMLVHMLIQIVNGALLGFFVLCAVSAIQAVGDILDTVGGFMMATGFDPLTMNQASVMARLHQLIAVTLLFAGEGHLMVLHGLARSMQAKQVPSPDWDSTARAVSEQLSGLLIGAVEIAAPIMITMMLADFALGLMSRAAPALNAFALGFPLKIMFTILLTSVLASRIPEFLTTRIEEAVLAALRVTGVLDADGARGGG
jgi:flagellar biosynthetic protein FliR